MSNKDDWQQHFTSMVTNIRDRQNHWDNYFMEIANAVAKNSKCASRQLGAVLVRGHYIIATGYNGPPKGANHCGSVCPRRELGYISGDGLHLCPAAHAEVNCIATCARLGIPTENTTLYLNWVIPCKNCMAAIINAGIIEVVVKSTDTYDDLGLILAQQCSIKIRRLYVPGPSNE